MKKYRYKITNDNKIRKNIEDNFKKCTFITKYRINERLNRNFLMDI